jgi:hypothetical protein
MRFARLAQCMLLAALAFAPAAQAGTMSWDGSAITTGETFMRPTSIAIGPDDNVYVGDTDRVGTSDNLHPRVVSFSQDGVYVAQFETGFTPRSVAADALGNVYVSSDVFADRVTKFTPQGTAGTQFAVADPSGVAVNGLGDLFVAGTATDEVFRFDSATGAALGKWAPGAEPWGLATTTNGDVYVAKFDTSEVTRYEPDGTPATSGSFASPRPESLAVDSAGNVYVTSGDGVRKYDSSGSFLGIWSIGQAVSVAVDDDGRVYVARATGKPQQAGNIVRLDPATETPTAALTASSTTPTATQLVTFDASRSTPPAFGTITHYDWDLDGDGTFETDGGTTPTISRRFAQTGTETVRVKVTASVGAPATKSITLDVQPPYTFVSANPNQVLTGQATTLDAAGSALEGSEIERFEWDLDGNGTFETDTGTTSSLEHAWDAPQTVTVGVRVTRSGGRTDTATAQVEVLLAPPPGEPGVSINGGAFATDDPHVTLSLVWPGFLTSALVSNDGGFGDAGSTQLLPVAPEVEWTLPSEGPERLPKTVYVRYRAGSFSAPETYTDDIVLDETAPAVTFAVARHRVLRVKARDGSTGVSAVKVKRRHAKRAFKTKQLAPAGSPAHSRVSTTVKLPAGLRSAYVRAVDAVGNKSRWRWIKFH